MDTSEQSVSHQRLKRAFDILCSGVGLLALWPVGLLIGLLIKLTAGGPIFYGQTRIGQFGKPFRIWKFRSMVVNADKLGVPLTKDEDPRILIFGQRHSQLVGIDDHGPEFPDAKRLPELANPGLPIEDGTSGRELDQQANQQPRRPQ